MKNAWKHILLATVLLGVSFSMSCVRDRYPNSIYDPDGDPTVAVALSVQMPAPAQTRADNDYLVAEQIRELRIVVVSMPTDSYGTAIADEAPFVEVNTVFNAVVFDKLGHSEFLFKNILSDRYKKIYFIANCEADYLDIKDSAGNAIDLEADTTYLPAGNNQPAPIDNCTFMAPTGTYANASVSGTNITDYCIPVTAIHELAVPSVDDLRNIAGISPELVFKIEKPLYLVHAVNKINVTIENNTGSSLQNPDGSYALEPTEVRLKSFTLSKISTGKSYLFAHLNLNDNLFADYQPSPDELNRPMYERRDLNPAWMQWLAAEAEKTRNDNNIEYYEWLKSYYLPATITNIDNTQTYNSNDWLSSSKELNPQKPVSWTSPTLYFPETIYIPEDADDQEYQITCVFEQKRSNGKIDQITYNAVLPHLESLFRNTHVKVRFSVTDNAEIHLTLVVQPWTMAPEEVWHYTHTVVIDRDGLIVWDQSTVENDNTDECRLLLKTNGQAAEGRFTISSPVNDEWYAYLIPMTGDPDAFTFVDAKGNDVETLHGIIDGVTPAVIRVRTRNPSVREQNSAKLQIMVRTADNRYLEADVCQRPPKYYTIIQNRNSF